jgi:hypothetical protein
MLRRTIAAFASLLVAVTFLTACSSGRPPVGDKAGGLPSNSTSSGTYASSKFLVPFEASVPPWLPVRPTEDTPHFLTWEQQGLPAIRFMVPVVVFRPGKTTPSPVPHDYSSYLLGQARNGARFGDQAEITIGGRPATIVTATTPVEQAGSLGCPEQHLAAGEGCFGIQPNLSLRIAVLSVNDQTLLIWLRTDAAADPQDTAAKVALFQAMLSSLRFRDQTPGPSSSPTPR